MVRSLWTGKTRALESHTVDFPQQHMLSGMTVSTYLLELHASLVMLVHIFIEIQLDRDGFVQAWQV